MILANQRLVSALKCFWRLRLRVLFSQSYDPKISFDSGTRSQNIGYGKKGNAF